MKEKDLGMRKDWPPSEAVMGIRDTAPPGEGWLDISAGEMFVC